MKGLHDQDIAKRHAAVARSRTFQNLRNMLSLGNLRVLDVGCGDGEYLAAFGPGSVGITTRADEIAYGVRAGLDIRAGNAEVLQDTNLGPPFDAIWANNLFEHLLAPHSFLIELKFIARAGGRLVLGVPVVPALPSLMRLRKFRGALANSHTGFYTRQTLKLTVERAGWKIQTVRPFFFQNAFLDSLVAFIAPHFYVVATNDTAFSYHEKKIREWESDPYYARMLHVAGTQAQRRMNHNAMV